MNWIWPAGAALAVLLVVYTVYCTRFIKTRRFELFFESLPKSFDGFRILQLSDLHEMRHGRGGCRIVRRVEREKPDIIVMTGDMTDRTDNDFSVFLELAGNLSKSYRIYYVRGNHEADYSTEKTEYLLGCLRSMGITVVDNRTVMHNRGEEIIEIVGIYTGLEFYNKITAPEYRKDPQRFHLKLQNMRERIGDKPDGRFTVLLAHNPQYFDVYAEWGAELVFSGHMHGGMVRLPFAGGVLAPDRTLFPKYCDGLFKKDKTTMVVSRGVGNGKFPVRFFNHPEITVSVLNRKNK